MMSVNSSFPVVDWAFGADVGLVFEDNGVVDVWSVLEDDVEELASGWVVEVLAVVTVSVASWGLVDVVNSWVD